MGDYAYARCLFCSTGKEESVVKAIHENGWGKALFPQRVKTIRQGREWVETLVPLLPGYVFVYSNQDRLRYDEVLGLRHVLRVLSYGDEKQDVLLGRDLEFADWIWRMDGRIGIMKALQVGDRIEIVDGTFKQLHGTITRMDKRRRTIQVDLNASGALRNIWLAYDIVEKLDENGRRISGPAGART